MQPSRDSSDANGFRFFLVGPPALVVGAAEVLVGGVVEEAVMVGAAVVVVLVEGLTVEEAWVLLVEVDSVGRAEGGELAWVIGWSVVEEERAEGEAVDAGAVSGAEEVGDWNGRVVGGEADEVGAEGEAIGVLILNTRQSRRAK